MLARTFLAKRRALLLPASGSRSNVLSRAIRKYGPEGADVLLPFLPARRPAWQWTRRCLAAAARFVTTIVCDCDVGFSPHLSSPTTPMCLFVVQRDIARDPTPVPSSMPCPVSLRHLPAGPGEGGIELGGCPITALFLLSLGSPAASSRTQPMTERAIVGTRSCVGGDKIGRS